LVDGQVRERGTATLREILAIIERERIEAIAVDNVYELASSFEELQSLLGSLTLPPRLVQVTVVGDRVYPLASLAASLGLGSGKLSPLQAAEVSARLCYMGVGSELQLFELNETRIVVSKGRTPAQGGMSAERYKRSIEARVQAKTREISELLREKGFDFDLFVTRGAYGVERSVFIVYAPKERVRGIVKPLRDHDIQITVEPVTRRNPSFVPLAAPSRRQPRPAEYLIVGVDPGVSTGVAALTLDGRLKLLASKREWGRGEVIRTLLEVGTPLVVCSDVTPPPAYVKKLATMLNAVLFAPPHSLSVEDKRRLVSTFFESSALGYLRVKDSHQRDSLAAALYALNALKPKLEEVRERIERLGLGIPLEEVSALVIKGVPVWDAIRQVSKSLLIPAGGALESDKQKRGHQPPRHTDAGKSSVVSELLRRIKELESDKQRLSSELAELKAQLDRIIQIQTLEVRKSRELETLRCRLNSVVKEIDALRGEVLKLKAEKEHLEALLAKAAFGEVMLVPRVGSLNSLPPSLGRCEALVVGTLQASDLERLRSAASKLGLKAIITEYPPPETLVEALASYDIAAITLSELEPIAVLGSIYVFDRGKLNDLAAAKLKELSKKAREHVERLVKSILESYRADRINEISKRELRR